MNQITHWLDASNVYGSGISDARRLRTFRGGKLRTGRGVGGAEMLPDSGTNDCKGSSKRCFLAGSMFVCAGILFGCVISCWLFLILFMKRHFSLVGDLRVNEQPNLAVMHTLFLREHNRISTALKKINPKWSDEKLYQESRRILIAEWQHIIYNEWLPLILGDRYMSRYGLYPLDAGYSRQYRTDFDPRITNAFASAAFRFGHSLIPRNIR